MSASATQGSHKYIHKYVCMYVCKENEGTSLDTHERLAPVGDFVFRLNLSFQFCFKPEISFKPNYYSQWGDNTVLF